MLHKEAKVLREGAVSYTEDPFCVKPILKLRECALAALTRSNADRLGNIVDENLSVSNTTSIGRFQKGLNNRFCFCIACYPNVLAIDMPVFKEIKHLGEK